MHKSMQVYEGLHGCAFGMRVCVHVCGYVQVYTGIYRYAWEGMGVCEMNFQNTFLRLES